MAHDAPPEQDEYVPRRMHRTPRHTTRTVLLSLLMVVVTVLGVGGAYAGKLSSALATSNSVDIDEVLPSYEGQPIKDPGDESINILLLGADHSDSGEKLDFSATSTDQRSDSMMLVHIPADRSGVYIMSIMRDTWVEIPGHGHAKINAAMQYGGVPLLAETLQNMLGVKIDNFAAVDFNGFRGLTKAIGGVTVNNPKAFCAYKTTPDVCFEAGNIHVEGQRALKWVRERHAFIDGDYQRVRNQQQFLKAVFKKTLSPAVLADPFKVMDLANEVLPYVTMDSDLRDPSLLAGLASQMRSLRSSDIHSFTMPNDGTGTSADGQSIVVADEAWIAKVGKALKSDDMEDLYSTLPEDFRK